jgi:hypothetical protein
MNKEKSFRRFISISILMVVSLLVFSTALCTAQQSSPNYSIDTDVLSGGGSECSSTSYFLMSTLGQPTAIGPASSMNYLNYAGFWYTLPQPQEGCYYLGDLNCDDVIDISDVILELRLALQLDPPKSCSDINADTVVDISDVILTLRMALVLDAWKPC